MSTELPTEEDVLAVGLLWWVCYESDEGQSFPSEWADDFPDAACAVWRMRRDASNALAAIADSERRLAWEEARDSVVAAARIWDGQGGLTNLCECLGDLYRAERALEGK